MYLPKVSSASSPRSRWRSSPGMPCHGCASDTSQRISRRAALARSCSSSVFSMSARSTGSAPSSRMLGTASGTRTAKLRSTSAPRLCSPSACGQRRMAESSASAPPASRKAAQLGELRVVSAATSCEQASSVPTDSEWPASTEAAISGTCSSPHLLLTSSSPARFARKPEALRQRSASTRCACSRETDATNAPSFTSVSQIFADAHSRERVRSTSAAICRSAPPSPPPPCAASPAARLSCAPSSCRQPMSAAARARSKPLLSATRPSSCSVSARSSAHAASTHSRCSGCARSAAAAVVMMRSFSCMAVRLASLPTMAAAHARKAAACTGASAGRSEITA
mmetsp:Transcript_19529/g.49653  ORF Transcript_19529/g.49653 Transcript_19529/m.49653 type:complete len:339 (+) Transcript_19529:267-1283(+)